MGKKAKADPTRAERLAALKREFNLPVGKVKNPATPEQQKASLKKLAEGIAAMDEELADIERAMIIERISTGAILPTWAEKLLKPASKPPSAEQPKPASEPEPKSEKKPGPALRRAIPILIELNPPTGIPPDNVLLKTVKVIVERNRLLPEDRKEPEMKPDSVSRAILVLKKRNAP
jgi:hypothetical protein